MILQEYIAAPGFKLAVVSLDTYTGDPIAQSISQSPTKFKINNVAYVFLSIEPYKVNELVAYIESGGNSVEFEFVQGSGKVSLLLHEQALALMDIAEPAEESI